MKKVVFVIAVFLISQIFLYAASAEPNWEFTRSFSIQAGRDEFATINITPISAQSENYRIGMPFNIEDSQVQYSNTAGRTIAEWSLISNTAFELLVEAEELHYIGALATDAKAPSGLPYILSFQCTMSLASGRTTEMDFWFDLSSNTCGAGAGSGTAQVVPEGATISSEYKTGAFLFEPVGSISTGLPGNAYLGSLDGTIVFRFSQGVTPSSDEYHAGQYEASVRITLSVNE